MKYASLTCLLYFLFLDYVDAQSTLPANNAFNKPPVNIISPDVASLGTYGTYNVNLYTGSPSINLPLYELKESGVNIPITINYDASGFIPNKNSSQVGMNWNLYTGGVITRVVKGVPDEKRDPNWNSSSLEDQLLKYHTGYIYGIQHPASTLPTQSEIENLRFLTTTVNASLLYPTVQNSNVNSEYNPDIFSFNFLGHSGTFVMGNDGVVKVNSDRRYKVDLSGLKQQYNLGDAISNLSSAYAIPDINTDSNFSRIVITSDDGYVFQFGGKFASLEVSFSTPNFNNQNQNIPFREVIGTSGVINAWHLTKIITPDGDEIKFDYGIYNAEDKKVLNYINSPYSGNWDTLNVGFLDVRLFWGQHQQIWDLYNNSGYQNVPAYINKSIIKMAYLKTIETKSKNIIFSYSLKNEADSIAFYRGDGIVNFVNKNHNYYTSKLDQITVEDKFNIAQPAIEDSFFYIRPRLSYQFFYQYFGDSVVGKRLFLKEVVGTNTTHYNFSYARIDELPHPMTFGIDKWGYYNGVADNSRLVGLIGATYGDPNEYEVNFSMTGQNRVSNATKADIGILSKIVYPTGGYTEFAFEAHSVNKILKKKVNSSLGNSMIPEWNTLNPSDDNVVGGCRIKTITSYAEPGAPALIKRYKYIKDYNLNPNGVTSGLLMDYGVYRVKYERTNSNKYHDQVFDQNISKANGINEPHVCYSEVVEIAGDSTEGFTKYVFTNPDDQSYNAPIASPDNYYIRDSAIRIFSSFETRLANQLKRLARFSSRASERGNLALKETYSNANMLIASETFEYNTNANRFNEKTVGYEKIYNQIYPDNVSNPAYAYFFNSFQIYNYQNNITKSIVKTFSNGRALTQTTNFVYKGNANPLLSEKIITKSDGSIYKTKYYYAEDRIGYPEFPVSSGMVTKNMVAKVLEEQLYKDTTLLQTQKYIYGDATGNQNFKLLNTKTINHTIVGTQSEQWMNLTYYGDGSVKESNKVNDLKTAYIWGYNKTLPIAEVKNVDTVYDIAYTSFETNESWNINGYNQWIYDADTSACKLSVFCPTGSKSYLLGYNSSLHNISRQLNPAKQYVLSLWHRGQIINVGGLSPIKEIIVDGWTYKEYSISGLSNITISGIGEVDELRLYPKGSFMTTYTYQPLFGISSVCDENNNISYYHYDRLGRLTLVRDRYRNILKKICYTLAGTSENCAASVYRNTFKRQLFTKNDCGAGYEGSTVAYTVQSDQYNSQVSQADADLQANQDIQSNGQAYANANGVCNCTANSCSGIDKKCINGVCQTGVRKNISSTYNKTTKKWTCVYVYEWSDCSHSQQFSETNNQPCAISGICGD